MIVAVSLAAFMCNNDLPANIVGQAPVPPLLVNSVMINQSNHAENVLISIRRPPGPPEMLMVPNHNPKILLPQLLLQPGNENLNREVLPEEHVPPTGLNHQQQVVYHICSEYFSYESRRSASLLGGFEQSVAPPILLIHGALGTGKSYCVNAISDWIHELGLGDMTRVYTDSAASNLGGGQTILSMLGIEMTRPGINEHLSCLSAVAITRLRVAFQYNRPDQVAVIFIDEILLVTSILLSMIDKHLREILDSRAAYGGVSMILLGDFQQLDPVSGVPLTKSVVDHLVYN
jgi:hypothetical protein